MDFLVTVDAASIDNKPRPGCRIVWICRMSRLDMTLLAEAGNPHLQESRIRGAVRFVTVRTALDDWRMLPQERSPFLGMTRIAVLVDRIFPKHRLCGASMRIVTVAATDLTLAQRHMRAALELSASGLMALRADLDVGRFRQIVSAGHRRHHGMTRDAGHSARFVGASLPEGMLALFVTAVHARGILRLDRLCPLLEGHQCLQCAPLCFYVPAPWTVTRLTSPLLLRRTRVHRHNPPHFCLMKTLSRLLVTRQAGIAPDIFGVRSGTGPLGPGRSGAGSGRRLRMKRLGLG